MQIADLAPGDGAANRTVAGQPAYRIGHKVGARKTYKRCSRWEGRGANRETSFCLAVSKVAMERSSVVRSIHWLPILIVVGAGLVPPAGATEKHWIAHEADAIVVGTLTTSPTFPWVDGWHINGVIRVDETLYGGRLPSRMNFRLVCRWDEMCRWWPPPVLTPIFKEKGLWFLRRLDNGNWKPSVGLGFQRLSDRAYWENYIRLYKR